MIRLIEIVPDVCRVIDDEENRVVGVLWRVPDAEWIFDPHPENRGREQVFRTRKEAILTLNDLNEKGFL